MFGGGCELELLGTFRAACEALALFARIAVKSRISTQRKVAARVQRRQERRVAGSGLHKTREQATAKHAAHRNKQRTSMSNPPD